MFDHLQNKFSKIFKIVKGHGKITEKNISDSVREIRIALLESDVNFKIVSSFISKVKDKASGEKVFDSITPGQQFIKIVLDELIAFLSSDDIKLNLSKNSSTKLIVAGLQGSGKTTTSAKIAGFLKREYKKKPILIGCDVHRPAAKEQLHILSQTVEVDFYTDNSKNILDLVQNGLLFAEKNKNDLVIIDTAGRLHIDDEMIFELESIVKLVEPDELLYVVDSMTGQDAVNSSLAFSEKFPITGSVLTKMDGNSGGGAALSIKHITGKPIKFMTSGESIDKIEKFDAERVARRILGLGDIIGLVEKAEEAFDLDNASKLQEKITQNKFDFNDFLDQLNQFSKMGSMKEILKYMPVNKNIKNINIDDKQLIWTKAIISSMTLEERKNPELLNGSRRNRIAKGSGRSVADVNKLIKQFNQIRTMIKKSSKMNLGKFPFKF